MSNEETSKAGKVKPKRKECYGDDCHGCMAFDLCESFGFREATCPVSGEADE